MAVSRLLQVIWIDAMTEPGWDKADEFVTDFTPCVMETVGYEVVRMHGYLLLAATHDADPEASAKWGDISAIPEGCITDEIELAPKAKKR